MQFNYLFLEKGNFSGLFFSRTSRSEGEFPRDYLINIVTCLFAYQKPVYTVKIVISELIAFAAVLYFGQVFVFCRLTNKSVLEWY